MDSLAVTPQRKQCYGEGTEERKDSRERGQSSCTEEKPAWPLYLPTSAFSSSRQRKGECSSYTSSGDLPSTSTSDDRNSSCSSPSSCSVDSINCDDLEETYKRAKLISQLYQASAAPLPSAKRAAGYNPSIYDTYESSIAPYKRSKPAPVSGKSPLFILGSDVMAQVMTFLEPPEILKVLTMPLCKEWRQSYTSSQDIWRVLCLLEPFKANVGDDMDDSSSDDDSFCSFDDEPGDGDILGRYRLMYTSFVRCMKYLVRIEEDTRSGRPPSVIDYGHSGFPNFGVSKGLKKFLARKKGILSTDASLVANAEDVSSSPIGVSDDGGYSTDEDGLKRKATQSGSASKKPKLADSGGVASKLHGSTADEKPSHRNVPRSCAIYSIVNWMVAYPDVEGIQTMCVSALPCLLEDEQQRLTAQRVGLVEVVLRSMLRFRDSLKLHTAAFHTMVLLARPLGGREGMLFDNSMAEASTSLGLLGNDGSTQAAASLRGSGTRLNSLNGIDVMMDSMRRFENEGKLQAMACWAMVNLALVPLQKTMLISLDGIQATVNAMLKHPHDFDVQFRAMFALINLVVPCKTPKTLNPREMGDQQRTEKDVLDNSVGQIIKLVVMAMKNFCSSETILNRACLVLHNLSQSQDYLTTLLWTPHCYQMLEWCITNHPTDQVLRRSAVSTLHRLQVLLSGNDHLRARFAESIRAEQELPLRNAAAQSQNA